MRTRSLRVALWLLPWAWAVGVSTAIAFAAGQGLVHVLGTGDMPAQASATQRGAMRQIQIVLMHADRPSSVMQCMAYANNVTSDVLEFWEAADVEQAVHSLCTTPVELVDGRPR
jgi:hypothetical protein